MKISNFKFQIISLLFVFLLLPSTAYAASPSPSVSASATPSATPGASGKSIRDNLRERVEEKLTKLINKPRAFVGKITQISNSALTIETKTGIKQVKVIAEQSSGLVKTVIVQVDSGKSKTIKEADLAVGNFVVAMGYTENGSSSSSSKDTIEARRILTMSDDPLEVRRPVYGIVQSAKDGTFVVKHPKKDETWTVKTSSKTEVTLKTDGKMGKSEIKSIAEGDRIIAVGIPVKNATFTISAELIHVIPGEAHGLVKSPSPSPKATKSPTP